MFFYLLHRIVKSWVEPNYKEVKRLVCPILEWRIWSCVKGINEDTSAAETDMITVTLPSQKLKSWQKLRLEGTLGKCPEAHRVTTPQINTGSVVVAAASLLVSHSKIYFCASYKHCNENERRYCRRFSNWAKTIHG